jgi:hypothetical protein
MRAALGLAFLLAGAAAVAAGPAIEAARYAEPTGRYPHGVLGDEIEHGALVVTLTDGSRQRARLDEARVFEDTEPRLADLDGDGAPEVIAVESHADQGARLAVWGLAKGRLAPLAATPFIGARFRWLAPLGAADLDGDGRIEIAYVDRPHLARVLRVWRYVPEGPSLEPVASAPGHTNHRIGEPDIAGGVRDCGRGPEIVTADPSWQRLLATRLAGDRLDSREIGRHLGRKSFRRALDCR